MGEFCQLDFQETQYSNVFITSTMGKFASWFAGRLTCDSKKVSNSKDFEDQLHNRGYHIL